MEADLASQPAPLLGSCLAQPQDSQAGCQQMGIQPAPVVDILDARVPQLATVPAAARGHQDQVAAASFQLVAGEPLAASCLLLPTAVARAEPAHEANLGQILGNWQIWQLSPDD